MRKRTVAVRGLVALAIPAVMAAVLAGPGAGAASAATCLNWTGLQPPNPGSSGNQLNGVTTVSSCRAWAVGQYFNGFAYQTLIARWNGTGWTQQSSPDPAGSNDDNILSGVAATSASNAWAVGYYGFTSRTLIEHWNGSTWTQVPSPSPGSANQLYSVAATSASNAWAVGSYYNGTGWQTLAEHWNGTSWKRVASPDPAGAGRDNLLLGVTAISARNAWAVGYLDNGTTWRTLIEHWNGSSWKRIASPDAGGSTGVNQLRGAAAASASNIWAVGSGAGRTLIMHWNGRAWKQVASPTPHGLGDLQSVAVTAASAWAVGASYNGVATQTLIERWNGTSWKSLPSPDPAGSATNNRLHGVAATSATNVWTAGNAGSQTLALHCC